MKLYLGSKMVGVKEFGHAGFQSAADQLRELGHEVFNPAEKDREIGFDPRGKRGDAEEHEAQGFTRRDFLNIDMAWIGAHSEGMIVFGLWRDSPGARAEVTYHHALFLPVWELDDFLRDGEAARQVLPLTPGYDDDDDESRPWPPPYDPCGTQHEAGHGPSWADDNCRCLITDCDVCPAVARTIQVTGDGSGRALPPIPNQDGPALALIRTFPTGADRDLDDSKIDYDGFLSPAALRAFGEYMHGHRVRRDGTLRASDNWKRGIPRDAYVKSLLRHVVDVWTIHRGGTVRDANGKPVDLTDALCASWFNVQGYLHEYLKDQPSPPDAG